MIFMNFNFTRFGPLSSYLKLRNENIGINVAKLNMKEFTNKMDRLKKKESKETVIWNKQDVSENAEAFYNGLNIIVYAFDRDVFWSINRPIIDTDYDLNSDQEPDLLAASD